MDSKFSPVSIRGWVLLAVLALGVFTTLGFLQKPKVNQSNEKLTTETLSISEPLALRFAEGASWRMPGCVEWMPPPVPSNSNKWAYDVFTPPRIYINPETGNFEPTAYQFSQLEKNHDLKLIGVRNPLFKYQLSGFVENSLEDASLSILLIEDLETHTTRRLHFSKNSFLDSGYRMLSFTIQRITTDAGAIRREGKLVVASESGTRLTLNSATPTYSTDRELSLQFGGSTFLLSKTQPSLVTENSRITWILEPDGQDGFSFEIVDLETSETHHVFLESYLDSAPDPTHETQNLNRQ